MASRRGRTFFLKRLAGGVVGTLAALALIAYAADSGLFRYRLANHQAFGQVSVARYDAVQQKNGKTVFFFNPPQIETCANTLFPHRGYSPCWYLRRHAEQRTDI